MKKKKRRVTKEYELDEDDLELVNEVNDKKHRLKPNNKRRAILDSDDEEVKANFIDN